MPTQQAAPTPITTNSTNRFVVVIVAYSLFVWSSEPRTVISLAVRVKHDVVMPNNAGCAPLGSPVLACHTDDRSIVPIRWPAEVKFTAGECNLPSTGGSATSQGQQRSSFAFDRFSLYATFACLHCARRTPQIGVPSQEVAQRLHAVALMQSSQTVYRDLLPALLLPLSVNHVFVIRRRYRLNRNKRCCRELVTTALTDTVKFASPFQPCCRSRRERGPMAFTVNTKV